jgi:hypothetical protein
MTRVRSLQPNDTSGAVHLLLLMFSSSDTNVMLAELINCTDNALQRDKLLMKMINGTDAKVSVFS